MRILLIHSDHFEYSVRQPAVENPEKISEDRKTGSMDDVLVAFSTIEAVDEKNIPSVVNNTAISIEDVAHQVNARKVMIYPYAHLSSSLGSGEAAIKILSELEDVLTEKGFEVARSPFGWYKSFSIKCKGHPLSELSRTIGAETPSIKADTEEVDEPSRFVVLETDGTEAELDLRDVDGCKALDKYPLLRQFILSEEVGNVPHEAPPHLRLMRRLELVDYEPASDIGHFRYYPRGALVKSLLEDYASNIALEELKAMRIETPSIYRLDQPDIASQAERFREKDYRFRIEDRDLTLRFAGDFGLFRMMKNATMTYKQLPIRIFELSPSYRLEQRGECVGLKRLRAFTMPDVHCFGKDLEQGMSEYTEILRQYTRQANAMEIDYVVVFRVHEKFYNENRGWFISLLKIVEKPAMFELLPVIKHYWIAKHEFQALDSVGGNAQLSTVQLDIEDSERYGIEYVDSDGKKRGCIIVHSSLGSIERWMYALLEQAETNRKRGRSPMLPVWLSPTQVRILPVSDDNLRYAGEVADRLETHGIRVDVDDRDATLGNKIREAETSWIPFIVVAGEKEEKSGVVSVRTRSTGEQRVMEIQELEKTVNSEQAGKPRRTLNMPRNISARPKFV